VLRLASAVLPLCRRWVIDRMIAGNIHWKTVDQVLEGDSRLVELIAGVCT
jgi:hypothetical protein